MIPTDICDKCIVDCICKTVCFKLRRKLLLEDLKSFKLFKRLLFNKKTIWIFRGIIRIYIGDGSIMIYNENALKKYHHVSEFSDIENIFEKTKEVLGI